MHSACHRPDRARQRRWGHHGHRARALADPGSSRRRSRGRPLEARGACPDQRPHRPRRDRLCRDWEPPRERRPGARCRHHDGPGIDYAAYDRLVAAEVAAVLTEDVPPNRASPYRSLTSPPVGSRPNRGSRGPAQPPVAGGASLCQSGPVTLHEKAKNHGDNTVISWARGVTKGDNLRDGPAAGGR